MEIKKLRPPTKAERLEGLPKSREAAIKQGITRYFRGDEEYVIRNFGSKTAPQGRDTKAALRKASRGGGSQGSRKLYETLSTPTEAQTGQGRRDFGKAMVEARQKGLVGDHKYSVARTGNALKDMSPERQALMHKRFKDAGIDIGNQKGNIEEVTEKVNYAKVGEERRLDKHLKNLKRNPFQGKTYQQIYASIRENISGTTDYKVPLAQRIFGEQVIGNGNGNGNGRQTQSGALALEKTRSTAFISNATNIAQLAMRNLGLLNMISETATKKKFTTHLGDAAKRGYGNFILAINDPDQRKSDIEQQQMELSSTQNFLKPYQDNLRETIDSTDISTL